MLVKMMQSQMKTDRTFCLCRKLGISEFFERMDVFCKQVIWMKKIVSSALILILVLAFDGCGKETADTGHTFVTSIPILDITDKFSEDEFYVTIVLDDCIVEEYRLTYNELTVPVNEDIYDEIVVNEGFSGVTLQVTIPDGQPKSDIRMVLKDKLTQYCKIISVTTTKNIVIN